VVRDHVVDALGEPLVGIGLVRASDPGVTRWVSVIWMSFMSWARDRVRQVAVIPG
jgi:hypothetical protein